MHHVDRATPWDEIWEAMEILRQQGKILYVGSSNFAGWHIAQGQEAARRRGRAGPASASSRSTTWSSARSSSRSCPQRSAYGLGVIPWSPLHGGLLGGVLRKQRGWDGEPASGRGGRAEEALEKHRPAIETWEGYCDERGEAPGDVALAWLLHQPAVTAPIVGPRNVDQLDGALRALDICLDEEALDRIDGIFPGPGGTAPEAYAW